MPYGTIAFLAAVILTARFLLVSGPATLTKVVVSAVFLASVSIGFLMPRWAIAGLLLQVALVIGLLCHAKWHDRS